MVVWGSRPLLKRRSSRKVSFVDVGQAFLAAALDADHPDDGDDD